jgi:hypothetical protein
MRAIFLLTAKAKIRQDSFFQGRWVGKDNKNRQLLSFSVVALAGALVSYLTWLNPSPVALLNQFIKAFSQI